MKTDKTKVQKILFITLSNLGDIILTTPVLVKLHEEFPQASIDVVTGSAGEEIFISHPAVKEVIADKRSRSLAARVRQVLELRRREYDLAVDLKNSLIPYLVGAKFYSRLTFRQDPSRHKRDEHLVKLAGLKVGSFLSRSSYLSGAQFFIPVLPHDKNYIEALMNAKDQGKKAVIINAGAKSPLKRWDADKYARLADRLIRELGCRIFLTGTADDLETVKAVTYAMKESAADLCGKTSVGALAELMKRCDLVVTNDSAPLHVASAVNAPTIAIFGPFNEKKYGPLADKSVTIKPEIPCRPCDRPRCRKKFTKGCISFVKVEEVFQAAKKMLSE